MLRSYELSLPKILRVMRLSELKTGEKGVIVKVLGHGGFRKRIVEMGFIKGKTVEVLLNAPLKDPIKYKVLGYEISLRRQEAEMIEVISEEEAKKLAEKHFDAFVSSDLKRSIDTCRIIAEPHHADVRTTPLLRERDWGSFTGRYIPDLKDEVWPDDVESLDTLKARAWDFLEFIKREYPGQTVLAVGHGIINKAIQAVYYNKEMKDVQKMTNAEVRVLDL